MKKKIFIDCQILQTAAYSRGMGKYCLSLLGALTENSEFKKSFNPTLIFSTKLETSTALLNEIKKQTHISNTMLVDIPTDISVDLKSKKELAKKELTKKIGKLLKTGEEADFLSLAPFFVGFPSVFPDIENLKKIVIVYDLIPLLVWQKQRIFPDDIYFDHFKLLFEADVLLSISNAVKTDLSTLLGIDSASIHNINGGAFEAIKAKSLKRRSIKYPYILYPSAPIIHKNNNTATEAFRIFNKLHQNRYKLVFTSSFDDTTKARLKAITEDLIFTGNVTDEELAELYQNADAVLFASLTEGLGMPVLEAVIYNKPVACSEINVLTEMSKEAFYLFDPASPSSIAGALKKAIDGIAWEDKAAHYPAIRSKYQWSNSASDFIAAINKVAARPYDTHKRRIEIVCPHPGKYNPEQQFVEYIYGALSVKYNVRLRFYGPSYTPKVPAFVSNYVSEDEGTTRSDYMIVVGKAPASMKLDNSRSVNIKVKRAKRLFRKSKRENFMTVIARPILAHKALGLRRWDYELAEEDKDLRKVLLNKIAQEINHV